MIHFCKIGDTPNPRLLIYPLIMLAITINNKDPKNMIKDINFTLERKRKKKKERPLIDSRNNHNFNPMLRI